MVIHATTASIEKGESLKDTGRTLQSIVDAIVIRHPSSGAPLLLSRLIDIPIINAGDGMHAHPSQALLDAFTILNHKKSMKGLKIVTIGDIFHSRVARSDAHLFSKLGARVVFCGPDVLLPESARELTSGVEIVRDMDEAIRGADVVMMLRVQQERLSGMQINVDEYIRRYQLMTGQAEAGQEGCHCHASRPHDSRHGDDRRGCRLRPVGGAGTGIERREGAHGNPDDIVGRQAMSTILLKGGHLIDPAKGFDALADVVLREGRVEELPNPAISLPPPGQREAPHRRARQSLLRDRSDAHP